MEDHYEFQCGEDSGWEKPLGVQSLGEASAILPPYLTSTGLEPEGPDPYLGTRDASYTYGNAKWQACKMDDMFSKGSGEKVSKEDAFSLKEDRMYSPWLLGENDMQSLFADLHNDDYTEAVDIVMSNLEVEGGRPFLDDWQVREIVRNKEKEFESWPHE